MSAQFREHASVEVWCCDWAREHIVLKVVSNRRVETRQHRTHIESVRIVQIVGRDWEQSLWLMVPNEERGLGVVHSLGT
jgi:hypothetical protein